MLVDMAVKCADAAGWEVIRAGRTVWIEVEQAVSNAGEHIAGHYSIGNLVVNLLRIHIVNVLRIVLPADSSHHAGKLAGLFDNVTDAAALTDPKKFAVRNIGTV